MCQGYRSVLPRKMNLRSLFLCGLIFSMTPEPVMSTSRRGDAHSKNNNDMGGNGNEVIIGDCFSPDDTTNNDSLGEFTCEDSLTLSTSQEKWNWEPTSSSHPCNILRLSQSELLRAFGPLGVPNLYPHPLVIRPDNYDSQNEATINNNYIGRNRHFANMTTLEHLPLNFPPNFNVTLTGSDSLSTHRRIINLSQYLSEMLDANKDIDRPGETLPDQFGNETWYLFGETFTKEWAEFLQHYNLPTCQSCTPLHRQQSMIALSFGIGNIGSGVQWHLHGPGFSETIHGRKHWVLYPPQSIPVYKMEYASRHWMENVYPNLEDWNDQDVKMELKHDEEFLKMWKRVSAKQRHFDGMMGNENESIDEIEEQGPSNKKPWECTINAGEMIYFPDGWHHATINLERYTVFVSSFTTEHN
mmetsp:Transcript_11962/g.26052  ORF Transcript_11962/g.26052 Transcript_11962/m.26052 type:complete len:413 (-) Transcript_11962:464-1702(-)